MIKVKNKQILTHTPIIQAGSFKIGENYRLNGGCYKNLIIQLKYISKNKQIYLNGERYRQIQGIIIESGIAYNCAICYLSLLEQQK